MWIEEKGKEVRLRRGANWFYLRPLVTSESFNPSLLPHQVLVIRTTHKKESFIITDIENRSVPS